MACKHCILKPRNLLTYNQTKCRFIKTASNVGRTQKWITKKLAPSYMHLSQASNRSSIQHVRKNCALIRPGHEKRPASPLRYSVMDPTETIFIPSICGSRHFCLKQIGSDLLRNQTATSRQNENHLGLKQSAARQGKTGFWQVWPHTVLLKDIEERA